MATNRSAADVISTLNLAPHPEKGYFIETFRDTNTSSGQRSLSTCIYYLLEGESGLSHWHRVLDATEVWHYYAGAPLRLSLSRDDGKPIRDVILGSDIWDVSVFLPWLTSGLDTDPGLLCRDRGPRSSWSRESGSMQGVWETGRLLAARLHRLSPWSPLRWRNRAGSLAHTRDFQSMISSRWLRVRTSAPTLSALVPGMAQSKVSLCRRWLYTSRAGKSVS